MNAFGKPPDKKELRAMLHANIATLAIYFGAIRATPLVRIHPFLVRENGGRAAF